MAPKPTATLTLADGETVVLDLDERDLQEAFYNLLNREGEYAGGWVEVHGGYWVNLAAVVKVLPRGVQVARSVAGFRFALVLENGEPADPAVFNTIVPTWRVGDQFRAGSRLQKFRILQILPELDEDAAFKAIQDRRAGELLGGEVAGVAVHTGARVPRAGGGREVLVSSTVKDLVTRVLVAVCQSLGALQSNRMVGIKHRHQVDLGTSEL